ncbi:hypothetical protein ASN18_2464 [Candidatus Magnetominusculus xianensis]|uniref:Uncharacterized protein n=1 Tax=Candidatus Magnetominusculus xianensis TaxID=1748249 RepID=A0ABR5SEY9_9BACT|nr:hypothetical protein ASN18_2464 [Candidatus Magnetominusculus xianensis]
MLSLNEDMDIEHTTVNFFIMRAESNIQQFLRLCCR